MSFKTILDKYAIQLRKEGVSFSDREPLIEAYKDRLIESKRKADNNRVMSDKINGYDLNYERLSARQPDLLTRKFNIDRTSKKKQ
tara:strand:+ start:160 stop:414 length:255 start_codon:yes stop_codon:yes gene_type:complete